MRVGEVPNCPCLKILSDIRLVTCSNTWYLFSKCWFYDSNLSRLSPCALHWKWAVRGHIPEWIPINYCDPWMGIIARSRSRLSNTLRTDIVRNCAATADVLKDDATIVSAHKWRKGSSGERGRHARYSIQLSKGGAWREKCNHGESENGAVQCYAIVVQYRHETTASKVFTPILMYRSLFPLESLP
jgi:hypothetical protein